MKQETSASFDLYLKIFLASLGLMILIIIVSGGTAKPTIHAFVAENITNTKEFSLPPYAYFTYNVTLHDLNHSEVVRFNTMPAPTCTILQLEDTSPRAATCIYPNGQDISNSSYALNNSLLFMYRPWMLGLKSGFRWNPATYLEVGGAQVPYDEEIYRVLRKEEWNGRPAYVVEIVRKDETSIMYIDEEYRILLEERESRASIIMLQGPFPLILQEE